MNVSSCFNRIETSYECYCSFCAFGIIEARLFGIEVLVFFSSVCFYTSNIVHERRDERKFERF